MNEFGLEPHARAMAERALDEESADRNHLVVHLSGAHAYGFPSPDSDLDLKAIHVERTERLLGLEPPRAVYNRLEFIEEVEVDYTSNELAVAVRGLIKGDGNMLERACSTMALRSSELLGPLSDLARKNVSRRYHHHYRGFARAQRKAVDEAEEPRAKKVLYVLRTALTGVHLLKTGECVPDLSRLHSEYGFDMVPELIEIKQQGEKQALPGRLKDEVGKALDRALTMLEEAKDGSKLPEEPEHVAELEAWLICVRRADLG